MYITIAITAHFKDGSAWDGDVSVRVNRGGGWGKTARRCRSALRGYDDPNVRASDIGFRLLSDV